MIINNKEDFNWTCLGRADLFDKELMTLMKQAGCWQISFGIESGSEKVLNAINKQIDLKEVENVMRQVKKNRNTF